MKQTILKIVNLFLFISASSQFVTGFFGEDLPPAFFRYGHVMNAYFLITLVVLHIYLNFQWILNAVKPKKKKA